MHFISHWRQFSIAHWAFSCYTIVLFASGIIVGGGPFRSHPIQFDFFYCEFITNVLVELTSMETFSKLKHSCNAKSRNEYFLFCLTIKKNVACWKCRPTTSFANLIPHWYLISLKISRLIPWSFRNCQQP